MTSVRIIIVIIFLIVSWIGFSQSNPRWYAVYLTDKNNSPYQIDNPSAFLSERAITNRQKNHISIDSTDLPVNQHYLTKLNKFGKVKHCSKWQNSALLLLADSVWIDSINDLSFVKSIEYLGQKNESKTKKKRQNKTKQSTETEAFFYNSEYGLATEQMELIGIKPLHENGYLGEKVRIAVLDAGFQSANTMTSFQHLFERNGIVLASDVVEKGNDPYLESSHGTHVLSTIAANLGQKYMGTAPMADFILLRTEDVASEYPVEEFFWLVGAEIADSCGADIITSSLSYTVFDDTSLNHNHFQLDGKTTMVSRAASMAASKGIIVTTSAGNDGNGTWRKIGFPADGLDVLTIGATDTKGNYATLSSQGYAADGRIKPDVVAVGKGTSLINTNDQVFNGNGTSFSTPIIAGAVAILIQSNPSKTSKQIRDAVIQSSSQFRNPDSLNGYGIPNITAADLILKGKKATEPAELPFKILPNPFSTTFYILIHPTDYQNIKINIMDTSGKIVYENSHKLFNGFQLIEIPEIKELTNGIYVLKMETPNGFFTEKILKQE
ncbi:MAG: S8 family peptidase [Bacteroidales bacterium]|nr:S8 family peptidase [Bacteroidales bacterium]